MYQQKPVITARSKYDAWRHIQRNCLLVKWDQTQGKYHRLPCHHVNLQSVDTTRALRWMASMANGEGRKGIIIITCTKVPLKISSISTDSHKASLYSAHSFSILFENLPTTIPYRRWHNTDRQTSSLLREINYKNSKITWQKERGIYKTPKSSIMKAPWKRQACILQDWLHSTVTAEQITHGSWCLCWELSNQTQVRRW